VVPLKSDLALDEIIEEITTMIEFSWICGEQRDQRRHT
jgi:hypothetical protein